LDRPDQASRCGRNTNDALAPAIANAIFDLTVDDADAAIEHRKFGREEPVTDRLPIRTLSSRCVLTDYSMNDNKFDVSGLGWLWQFIRARSIPFCRRSLSSSGLLKQTDG